MPPDEDTTVIPAVVVPPVVIEEPPAETHDDNAEALAQIAGRIEGLETRISEAIEGERTWTTETITSLRQELADLKTNLTEISQGFPAQVQTLRDELTQLSQSLQTPPVVLAETTIPVVEPEEVQANAEDTPEAANAPNALPKGKRRVV